MDTDRYGRCDISLQRGGVHYRFGIVVRGNCRVHDRHFQCGQGFFRCGKDTWRKLQTAQVFWDSLHFGLSDAFTEKALREIAEDYIRLGIITAKDMTVDKVMEMAWTPLCPDSEIEGLTVGDPVETENAGVPVKQNEKPAKDEKFGLSK